MRSRYAAFVLGLPAYLVATLHPSKREPDLEAQLARSLRETEYLGLTVLRCRAGGPKDERGRVEFRALYRAAPIAYRQEDSRFVKEEGRWLYVDGEPRRAALGRNDPCWCASGKKLKKCHQTG